MLGAARRQKDVGKPGPIKMLLFLKGCDILVLVVLECPHSGRAEECRGLQVCGVCRDFLETLLYQLPPGSQALEQGLLLLQSNDSQCLVLSSRQLPTSDG